MSVGLPASGDERVFTFHRTGIDCVTNPNEYILSDIVSLDDVTERDLNSTKSKGPLEEMDMEDVKLTIKQELQGSDYSDSILFGDSTSASCQENNGVGYSKGLLRVIKLQAFVDSMLESQEKILPDYLLPVVLLRRLEDEKGITVLHQAQSDVFQDSAKRGCGNYLNRKNMNCDKINAIPWSNNEATRQYKINKENSLKINQPTAFVQVTTKTRIEPLRNKKVNKKPKKSNLYGDKDLSKDPAYLLSLKVNSQLKESKASRTENKIKPKIASNKNVRKRERVICKNVVNLHSNTMSVNLGIIQKNQGVDENVENIVDCDGRFDETHVSDNRNCCDNTFCECGKCKENRAMLLTTKVKPNRNSKYVCALCNRKFFRKCHLKEHEASKCGVFKPFSCDHCAKGFIRKRYLKEHKSKCQSTNISEKKPKLSCDLCDKQFSLKSSLRSHKKNIHFLQRMNFTYICEICDKVYRYKYGLAFHKKNCHPDEEFECGHCSKKYNSKEYLHRHIQSVHFQNCFKCSQPNCFQTFTSGQNLKNHEQSVHLCRGFICESCGKRFASKPQLQRHILMHSDEKRYVCHVCGKKFRTDSNLHQHSRIHSEIRPFSCDMCPKSFRIKHHLRQHMSVHGMVHTSVRRKQRTN